MIGKLAEKERVSELPGIGTISTAWIGRQGRNLLLEKFLGELETPKLASLKKELQTLAAACLKAFSSSNLEDSPLLDVQQAVSLCRNYLPKSSRRIDKAFALPMSQLWKESSARDCMPEDNIERATAVLGEVIVGTIIEKNKEPPHVSVYCVCVYNFGENFFFLGGGVCTAYTSA